MDNEKKMEDLRLEQKATDVAYDVIITANIYGYDPIMFAEKVLQFIKEKCREDV